MKIATTTGDFRRFCETDIERIEELHRAGFKYIDLSMYTFTPDCAYMQDGWRDEVDKLKDAADKYGIRDKSFNQKNRYEEIKEDAYTGILLK